MLAIVFGATTVICAVGWLVRWVACAALAKYMIDKGYTPPTDEERQSQCLTCLETDGTSSSFSRRG